MGLKLYWVISAGRKKMIWGIVALFVLVSIMGILRLVGGTLEIPVDTNLTGTGTSSGGVPGGNGSGSGGGDPCIYSWRNDC